MTAGKDFGVAIIRRILALTERQARMANHQRTRMHRYFLLPAMLLRFGRSAVFEGSFCVDMLRDDKHITLSCTCDAP